MIRIIIHLILILFQEAAFFEEMSQQTTMYPGACGQIPTFSPPRKMNSTRSIDSESPITDYTDEELFHLEMSDEGSGGKRSRLGKYSISREWQKILQALS